jgi:malonyl-CoA O-methyltransferase
MSTSAGLDPKAVRLQFGRRTERLARGDFLLREIERRMLERLDLVRLVPATVLDLGTGLGQGAQRLQQRYPEARVIGLDAAVPLLARAQGRHGAAARRSLAQRLRGWFGEAPGGAPRQPLYCAADAARLPLPAGRADLLWSNLAWHWFADPRAVAEEWYRVIRTEGLLMFSALGVDTLRELDAAGAPRPPFPDLHDVGDLLVGAGFADPVMDVERLTVHWGEPEALLADLRGLGGNALRGRAAGLAGRGRRARWLAALEGLRGPDGRIALTFEVVYGHAWCPAHKRPPAGYAAVAFVPRRAAGLPARK